MLLTNNYHLLHITDNIVFITGVLLFNCFHNILLVADRVARCRINIIGTDVTTNTTIQLLDGAQGSVSPRTRGSSSRNIDGDDDVESSRTKSKDPGIFPPMEEDRDDRKERSRDRRGSRNRDGENRRGGGSASRERQRNAENGHGHDGSSDPTLQQKPKEKSSNDDLETLDIEHQPVVRHGHRRRANSGSRVGDSDEEEDSDGRDDFAGTGERMFLSSYRLIDVLLLLIPFEAMKRR